MSTELLISNIGYALNVIAFLALGIFVLAKGSSRKANRLFALFSFFVALFFASHAFGVNAVDPVVSRAIFLFNACNIFLAIFCAHWVLVVIGKEPKRRLVVWLLYILGGSLFAFFMIFPDTFMQLSMPVLYFPNFYNEGSLYSLMVGYFLIIFVYFMFELSYAYFHGDRKERNKLKFVILGLGLGFLASLILELPLYHIYVDPILSAFIWLAAIPLAYTMIANDLMDMDVVAKQATVYVLATVIVTILIVIVNSLSVVISRTGSTFPVYAIPAASSLVIVLIGRMIWNKIKENEVIKYEFITIITHKFRTPLTSIKWSTENIKGSQDLSEIHKYAEYIEKSSDLLVELTGILMESSTSQTDSMQYHLSTVSLAEILNAAVGSAKSACEEKHITLTANIQPGLNDVMADKDRIRFVVQVLVDNAISYTPEGKNITVSLREEKGWAICNVKDEGIGIAKADLPRIFTKFYRSQEANTADPEGIGIGLYMAKTVIERQDGKIWAVSEGPGKGSTVGFRLKTIQKASI